MRGLDVSSAVYEWNYAGQHDGDPPQPRRPGEADRERLEGRTVFSERHLIKRRALLQALRA